ncbi:MAG: hypothetical protein QOD39_4859, partial [Mycobacterium sp.]|nr:hypothetical protein [Mycobacterium sp.]
MTTYKPRRPWLATAAVIGGAGITLSAPAAALLATAPAASAQPLSLCSELSLPSTCGSVPAANGPTFTPLVASAASMSILDIAGQIPVVNILIGNGANGTAAHPNGYNGGLLIGNGGNGYSYDATNYAQSGSNGG